MSRMNFVHVVPGKRGSGKTTYTKNNLIDPWMAKRVGRKDHKTLVLDTIDHPLYREWNYTIIQPKDIMRFEEGNARIIVRDWTETFNYINDYLWNCMIVAEDCTKYLRKGQLPEEVVMFLTDSKQKNLDLVFMYHGWGFIQPDMLRLADFVHILKTGDQPYCKQDSIGDFEEVEKAWAEVKASADPHASKKVRIN